jgi:hypothetical protein
MLGFRRYDEAAAYEQMIGRHRQCATNRLMPSSIQSGHGGTHVQIVEYVKANSADRGRSLV